MTRRLLAFAVLALVATFAIAACDSGDASSERIVIDRRMMTTGGIPWEVWWRSRCRCGSPDPRGYDP